MERRRGRRRVPDAAAGRRRRAYDAGAVEVREVNRFERTRWNDDRWTAAWPKRERLTGRVTSYLLEAIAPRPGEAVLDVGCGGGRTTIALAEAVGERGRVVGADISAQLAALARERAARAGVGNVRFEVLDVQTDPVPGAPFDAAASQFGVMFFEDPVAAFANVRAHLAPGGRLVFACWQELERNPWFFGPAVAEFVPPPPELAPGAHPTGAFALADAQETRAILERAGFGSITRDAHELEVDVPQDAVFDDSQLVLMGIAEADRAAAKSAAVNYLSRFAIGGGLMRFPLAFQLFGAATA